MVIRVLLSLFLGFMITTTCAFFMPTLRMVTGPVLCSGGELVQELPISNKRLNLYCQRDGKKEVVGLFSYLSVGMLIYSVAVFGVLMLFKVKLPHIGSSVRASAPPIHASAPQPHLSTSEGTSSALATVLDVQEGHSASTDRFLRWVELILTLRIDVPNGAPFETTVHWQINELHFSRVQIGCSFPVTLDSTNPQQIHPATDWAKIGV